MSGWRRIEHLCDCAAFGCIGYAVGSQHLWLAWLGAALECVSYVPWLAALREETRQ